MINLKKVEKVEVVEELIVDLELTLEEAVTLRYLLSKVGGDPRLTARGWVDSILNKLDEDKIPIIIGVKRTIDEVSPSHGNINFAWTNDADNSLITIMNAVEKFKEDRKDV